MQRTVLEEIVDLKHRFENGIYFAEYFSRKKLLKARIDYEVELRLDKAISMLVRHKISKIEYEEYRKNIEKSRDMYKHLLTIV